MKRDYMPYNVRVYECSRLISINNGGVSGKGYSHHAVREGPAVSTFLKVISTEGVIEFGEDQSSKKGFFVVQSVRDISNGNICLLVSYSNGN